MTAAGQTAGRPKCFGQRGGLFIAAMLFLAACGRAGVASPSPISESPETAQSPSPALDVESPSPGVPQTQPIPVPTPECARLEATPPNAEGPYYKAGSPERASLLEAGLSGARLVVTGYVLSTACEPIAGAWLDFWQADGNGEYDNVGYRLRGHQFSDDAGLYRLETILPAQYGSRPRHIHVKVQPPGGPILTTQLYFPDDPQAAFDAIFDPRLIVVLTREGDGYVAVFHFIVDIAGVP